MLRTNCQAIYPEIIRKQKGRQLFLYTIPYTSQTIQINILQLNNPAKPPTFT